MFHTLAHYAYLVSLVLTCLSLAVSIGVGLLTTYLSMQLQFASHGTVVTPRGSFDIPKGDIGVDWMVPGLFLLGTVIWMLITIGFHAI